jgi:predicted N-acetyltransferase YhbS
MSQKTQPTVVIRTATPADAPIAGQICYDAFATISAAHNFPCDLPSPEAAFGLLSMMFASSSFYSVVAESNGRIVGSNILDDRSPIRGVGPITIDPTAQNLGVGRKLMQAVMDRALEQNAAGVRLVQAAFHNRSLSLYTSLGFDIREPSPASRAAHSNAPSPAAPSAPLRPPTSTPATPSPTESTDSPDPSSWHKPSSTAPRK